MESQVKVSPIAIVNLEDDDDDDDDDDTFIAPIISSRGSSKINAISVEQYSEDRDLHLAIMASLLRTPPPHPPPRPPPVINLDLDDHYHYDNHHHHHGFEDDVQVLDMMPPSKKTLPDRVSVIEIGQSSNSETQGHPTPFMCEICVEPKPMSESFKIEGCTHFYCTDCMSKYVSSKLQDNVTRILCPVPNCPGLLEPEYCRRILPPEVFDRWGNALCESVLLGSEKFYCPFKDCSALLINDGGGGGGEVITQSECPNCWRFFCVQCKSPWHADIDCGEFQKLHKDERGREDIMMMKLAKNKNWKRCPKCKFYVEKSSGCMYMKCRCAAAFCYNCGALSTTSSHSCSNCKR